MGNTAYAVLAWFIGIMISLPLAVIAWTTYKKIFNKNVWIIKNEKERIEAIEYWKGLSVPIGYFLSIAFISLTLTLLTIWGYLSGELKW